MNRILLYRLVRLGTFLLLPLLLAAACSKTPDQALQAAAEKRDFAKVHRLIREGANPNVEISKGMSLLHFAAHQGSVPFAEFLIRHGAEVDLASPRGLTPLHLAARKGQVEVAKVLIDNGADVNEEAPSSG
ncbi:MAG: hypothetical protein GWN58_48190, partial [Anaerolineae bacterium]|nr:hypothetical protein [Anaerolineae bacterium]